MLVIKYKKTFPATAVSHIDLLRVMIRLLYRTEIKVEFSQGFNPHMLLFFSPPLTVGIDSQAEYMTVAAPFCEDFVDKFNSVAPSGIVATEVFKVSKNPNLAGIATAAVYRFECEGIGKCDFGDIVNNEEFCITYVNKQEVVTKKAGQMVFDVKKINDDVVDVTIACGNINLRADRLAKAICEKFGLDFDSLSILKTELYVNKTPVDVFLKKC